MSHLPPHTFRMRVSLYRTYSSYLYGGFLTLVLRRSGGLGGGGDPDLEVFAFLYDDADSDD